MLIIERITDDIVTIEDDDRHFTIKSGFIFGAFHEGDVLVFGDDGMYSVDLGATKKRRDYINKLQDDLWE